ncbi:MAG TPA: glutamyl-tRNA reductase [Acidimicrobiales bacterium]|nr:glutamyl-tRNA reductase [Acidimicrobiales bacterium]
MALISVGIDHEHASLDLLERATLPEHEWAKMLRTLVSHRNIHEAVFVSTCLRTEVVAVIDRFHGAIDEITETLAEATGLNAAEFEDRLTVNFEHDVASHLFSVAAGLKSVVPGEFEILGQLRRALELAVEEQSAGAEVTDIFQRAIASGRRVRSETAIARGTTSFAQAAASAAIDELGEELVGAHVVVLGAGQMAGGVVRGILSANASVAQLTILNRTRSRADALRDDLNDERVVVDSLESASTHLANARLVISALEVSTPVLSREHFALCENDVFIVDLGVPRAVASDVAELSNVRRIDISDLRERVERALGDRREAIDAAERIVAEDVEKFLTDQRARGAAAIVRELRDHFDELVTTELARRGHDLEGLTPEQRESVTSLVRSVVAKIAHRPTVALKEAAGTDQGTRLSEATRNLFDL